MKKCLGSVHAMQQMTSDSGACRVFLSRDEMRRTTFRCCIKFPMIACGFGGNKG
jgi:hypothetical protein